MVISYRNQFLKVFLSSLALDVLIILFLVQIVKYTASSSVESPPDYIFFLGKYLLVPVGLLAYGLNAWSCYLLVKAKGYSGGLALLALINIIGLAIIFLLPDRRKNG